MKVDRDHRKFSKKIHILGTGHYLCGGGGGGEKSWVGAGPIFSKTRGGPSSMAGSRLFLPPPIQDGHQQHFVKMSRHP